MLFYEQGSGLDGRPITLELGREYLCHYLGFEPSASEARAAFEFSGFILREPPASADLTIGSCCGQPRPSFRCSSSCTCAWRPTARPAHHRSRFDGVRHGSDHAGTSSRLQPGRGLHMA